MSPGDGDIVDMKFGGLSQKKVSDPLCLGLEP